MTAKNSTQRRRDRKGRRDLWVLMALLLGLLGAVELTALTGTAPALSVGATNLVNAVMVDWTPRPDWDTNGTGSGTVSNFVYSGPAYVLSANGLAAGEAWLIETSTDLMNWQPFPQASFQLTLWATNSTTIVTANGPYQWFRAKKTGP